MPLLMPSGTQLYWIDCLLAWTIMCLTAFFFTLEMSWSTGLLFALSLMNYLWRGCMWVEMERRPERSSS